MNQTIVSTKYQIVIPRQIRKKIKVEPGQKMNINISGDQIILSPTQIQHQLKWPQDHIKELTDPWKGEDAQKYLDKERNSWED